MKKKFDVLLCFKLAVGSGGVDAVVGDKITLLIPLFLHRWWERGRRVGGTGVLFTWKEPGGVGL